MAHYLQLTKNLVTKNFVSCGDGHLEVLNQRCQLADPFFAEYLRK